MDANRLARRTGSASTARTYHLRPGYRRWTYVLAAFSASLGGLLVVLFMSIPGPNGGSVVPFLVLSAAIVVLFGGVAVFVVRAGSRVAVTIGPEGVEYRSLGYRLDAPWSDVESLGNVILGAMSGAGLTLRQSAVAPGGGWIRIARLFDEATLFGPGYDRLIPLEPFAKPLPGSQLLGDLRGYIPELVTGFEERTSR